MSSGGKNDNNNSSSSSGGGGSKDQTNWDPFLRHSSALGILKPNIVFDVFNMAQQLPHPRLLRTSHDGEGQLRLCVGRPGSAFFSLRPARPGLYTARYAAGRARVQRRRRCGSRPAATVRVAAAVSAGGRLLLHLRLPTQPLGAHAPDPEPRLRRGAGGRDRAATRRRRREDVARWRVPYPGRRQPRVG